MSKIILNNFTAISSPKFANASCSVYKDSTDHFITSINVSLFYDVSKVVIVYNFSIPRDKDDRQFSKLLMKKNVDVCRMANGNMGDKIGKMIMDELSKYADYEIKCPFRMVKIIA